MTRVPPPHEMTVSLVSTEGVLHLSIDTSNGKNQIPRSDSKQEVAWVLDDVSLPGAMFMPNASTTLPGHVWLDQVPSNTFDPVQPQKKGRRLSIMDSNPPDGSHRGTWKYALAVLFEGDVYTPRGKVSLGPLSKPFPGGDPVIVNK